MILAEKIEDTSAVRVGCYLLNLGKPDRKGLIQERSSWFVGKNKREQKDFKY